MSFRPGGTAEKTAFLTYYTLSSHQQCKTLPPIPMNINFEHIFSDAFDTFKVFEGLSPETVGDILPNSPSTLWQILNHLLLWQEHGLKQLIGGGDDKAFWELDSWIAEKQPENQQALALAVERFYQQLNAFKGEVEKLRMDDPYVEQKLRILHEAAIHLSFHVGEAVLCRRLLGQYPMPAQMKEFLAS